MDLKEILPYIGTGFAGVALTKLVDYALGLRKINADRVQFRSAEGRQNFQAVTDAQKELNELLQAEIKRLSDELEHTRVTQQKILNDHEDEVVGLELKIADLSQANQDQAKQILFLHLNLILLESASADLPIPMWLKNYERAGEGKRRKMRMALVNPAFETTFLEPMGKTAADYIGCEDSAIWGDEVGRKFAAADFALIDSSLEWIVVKETIRAPGLGDLSGQYLSLKYKRYGPDKSLLGIGGYAIPNSIVTLDNLKPI